MKAQLFKLMMMVRLLAAIAALTGAGVFIHNRVLAEDQTPAPAAKTEKDDAKAGDSGKKEEHEDDNDEEDDD